MTTLERVVQAMGAELVRQTEENRGTGDFACETGSGAEWRLDGRFDLERVARASVAALLPLDEKFLDRIEDSHGGLYKSSVEYVCSALIESVTKELS